MARHSLKNFWTLHALRNMVQYLSRSAGIASQPKLDRLMFSLAGWARISIVQLIHLEDAGRALVEALRPELKGVYNVTGPGEVPLSAAVRELGHTPIPVPHPVARPRRAIPLPTRPSAIGPLRLAVRVTRPGWPP